MVFFCTLRPARQTFKISIFHENLCFYHPGHPQDPSWALLGRPWAPFGAPRTILVDFWCPKGCPRGSQNWPKSHEIVKKCVSIRGVFFISILFSIFGEFWLICVEKSTKNWSKSVPGAKNQFLENKQKTMDCCVEMRFGPSPNRPKSAKNRWKTKSEKKRRSESDF